MPPTRRPPRAWSLALLVLLLGGCAKQPSTDLDGVVLIVVDTLRADRLGFMGHPAATTPHLDALAARGRVFERAMTPVPVTLPAVSSLLTGATPLVHGVRDNEGFVLDSAPPVLGEAFRRAGWGTAAVVGAAVLAADRGVARGFGQYDDRFHEDGFPVYRPDLRGMAASLDSTRRRADDVTRRAVAWLREHGGRPFFLLVHYFDVHAPYDPPPEFAARHEGRPYDGAIAATDAAIGRLLEALPERTLVVVVSDHGEGLGEHGEAEHGFLLYESTLHVPLVVAGPEVEPGRVAEPVSLVDVAPTLAARCGLGRAPGPDGRVLELRGAASAPSDRDLYAETLRPLISYGWQELRALRRGELKLIAARDRTEVYDLREDPAEQSDLAHANPQTSSLVRALDSRVGEESAEAVRRRALGRIEAEPDRSELLRSLGYVGDGGGPDEGTVERPHPLEALPRWSVRQRDKVRARTAVGWIEEGRYEPALSLLDSLLSRSPDRAELLHQRSRARTALGDSVGAREDLRRSLEVDPLYAPALVAQAEFLVREARFQEAIDALERLSGARPDDPDALYNLGVALMRVGRDARAREVLRRFVEEHRDDTRSSAVRRWLAGSGEQ